MIDRLRTAWRAFRGYAAAQDIRASAQWAPSGGSATTEVGAAAATVARRARDAVRNDPYATRIVDLWTGNAVGAGITTRWPDKAHADAWRRWAESTACDAEGRLDLYGLQALAMRAVVESGECFIRLLLAPQMPANPIGLRLQVLESDHLDTARNGVIGGAPTIQGIALGEAGEPIGYWLHRIHPGASWLLPGAAWLGSERIPATDVLHIYRKRRPGQLRDVSWLAPVLLRLRDLGDYEAALLMKASRGLHFVAFPFEIDLPGEDPEAPPKVTLRIDNVDRRIVAALRELQGVATVTIEVIRAANPDEIEAGPFAMQLVKATYDALAVQADLAFEDTLNARFPAGCYTPADYPGLF